LRGGAALLLALAALIPLLGPVEPAFPSLVVTDGQGLQVLTHTGTGLPLAPLPQGAVATAYSLEKGWALLRLSESGREEVLTVAGKTLPLPRLSPLDLPPPPPGPRLLWDSQGRLLLVVPREGKPLLYREGSLSILSFGPPAQTVVEAAFSPEGRFLALLSRGRTALRVAVLDVLGGGHLLAQTYGGKAVPGLAFAEGSLFLAASSAAPGDEQIQIMELDLGRRKITRVLSPPPGWAVERLVGHAGGGRLLLLLRPEPPLVRETEASALWTLHLGSGTWERWTFFRRPYTFGAIAVAPSASRRPLAAWLSPFPAGTALWIMGESPPHRLLGPGDFTDLRFIPFLPSRGEPPPGSMGLWCLPTWLPYSSAWPRLTLPPGQLCTGRLLSSSWWPLSFPPRPPTSR
ncbi:MAG: hypothetical protein QJR00_03625, partial [Bacillota bacterium]|nr:hypothetical protein [Bacillota bacterium]